MYGCVNLCYGFNLRPDDFNEGSAQFLPFYHDLNKQEGIEPPKGQEREWAEDGLEEAPYTVTAYSGSGGAPLGIGFMIQSWAYWDLEGPNGIIAWAKRSEDPTDPKLSEFPKRWEQEIPSYVKELLAKHGMEPRFFWCASTS